MPRFWNSREPLTLAFSITGLVLLIPVSFLMWAYWLRTHPIADAFGVKGSAFQIKERTIDAGQVRIGQPVHCTFHLFNASNESRHILNIRPGCSCAKVIHFSRSVGPRSWGEIAVEIDTTRKVGHRSSSLLIETDDPQRPRLNPLVTCWVLPAVVSQPERLQFVPEKPSGDFISQTVKVVGLHEDEKIEIREIFSSDPMIAIAKATHVGEREFSFEVAVKKAIPAGTTLAHVSISVKGSAQESVRIPVTVTNELRMKAEPALLELSVDNNTLQTAEFTVSALEQSTLEISHVQLPSTAQVLQQKTANNAVLVRLRDLKVTNDLNGKHLCLTTNHGEFRVPISVGARTTHRRQP